jgi:hypothetical protein
MKSVLSIDGGGMKGYVPCAVLVELERRAGKSCSEMFDMVAGTSIGGILACVISTGRSATEALKFFTEDGPKIFGHTQLFGAGGVVKPRYAPEPLEGCLMDRLGAATLSSCKNSLLVPAFDLVSYEPFFFKSSKFDRDYQLWQVGRATSAAQTYFPAFELGDMILWDGGNVANNPAACAAAEAIKIWGPDEKLRILSLGCGAASSKLPAQKLISAGIAAVGVETLGLLFDANAELPDYILRQFLAEGYYRIQPKFTLPVSIDGADDKSIANLQAEAAKSVEDFGKTIDDFLAFTI